MKKNIRFLFAVLCFLGICRGFGQSSEKPVKSNVQNAEWAPDRKTQYYCAPCSCDHDNHLFDEPGNCPSCQMKLIPIGKKNYESASPSPDGRRIAFMTGEENNQRLIFTAKKDGSDRVKIAAGLSPEFSPDGRWILYQDYPGDSLRYISADGKQRFNLSQRIEGENLQTPSWAPGSKSILLSMGQFPKVNVWQVSLETFVKTQITQGDDPKYAAVFSPDGKKIAYTQMSRNRDERGIFLLDPASGEKSRLTEKGEYVSWAPNGKKLAFHAPDGEKFSISTVDADGKNLTQLSSGEFDDEMPRWSADGRFIYFQSKRTPAGNWELYRMKPSGKKVRKIVE